MKLAILIPTYRPEMAVYDFLPTLIHIQPLAKFSTFLVNFQDPYDNGDVSYFVREVLKLGFKIRHTHSGTWERPQKMALMREQTAELGGEDFDLYLNIDDDFKFSPGTPTQRKSSGLKYLDCIDYMAVNDRCGAINVKSFLGGKPWGEKIAPHFDDMFATNRGLFLRKIPGMLFTSQAALGIIGGLEETIAVYSRIEQGYYPAKQMNNPTIHITGDHEKYKERTSNMHNEELIENQSGAFIRERWIDPDWKYDKRRVPKLAREKYKAEGGPTLSRVDLVKIYED